LFRVVNSLTYYGLFLTSSTLSGDRYINFLLSALVEYPAAAMEALLINR
jgi:OCT family organic cation transporter-like MFS transporter 4/5